MILWKNFNAILDREKSPELEEIVDELLDGYLKSYEKKQAY